MNSSFVNSLADRRRKYCNVQTPEELAFIAFKEAPNRALEDSRKVYYSLGGNSTRQLQKKTSLR